MAKSSRQYVFEGMEMLPDGLAPYVEKRLEATFSANWPMTVMDRYRGLRPDTNGSVNWDQQALLKVMNIFWMDVFKGVLSQTDRSIVVELIEVRNKVAHNEKFSYDDAERALDSARRLLASIGDKDGAKAIGAMRDEVLRTKFTEQARNVERRKTHKFEIEVETIAGLLPWREVVVPHDDVATGNFQQAEFAADLAKVHNGSAPSDYRDPHEFFARTYLTEGLRTLLKRAAKRMSGSGGDPIVELQTNFGGGKTHSMLALYHLAGVDDAKSLPGVDQLLEEDSLVVPSEVNRAVIVGTARSPLEVTDYPYNTTWGEMAYQLGGDEAYALVKKSDEKGIAPGSKTLEKLIKQCSPCIILIDEWVAYLRQIYKVDDLPSGTFDSNLTFVQSLTEAVKACPQALLVASLPASRIEVGDEGGQEALDRLKQTFSRVESSWQPATQEESYEIVRRRLFKEVTSDMAPHKDNTIKQFGKMYRENKDTFPIGCETEDYKRKIEKAYPIHPELFDQLYETWGALENFQRTRGVLRLMAQVIHQLWMSEDKSIMLMPACVPLNAPDVESELVDYLKNTWRAIISADIDGVDSTPYKIDKQAPNLQKVSATRRVARTLFLGTAPDTGAHNTGLDDKRINLGVVQPGEKMATFGDALRRLANQAKYLHSDLGSYWYSSKPGLNRMASEKAEQLEEALVQNEIDSHLVNYFSKLADRGAFDGVHCAPGSSADIPDDAGGVRAVVLGVKAPHESGKTGSLAMQEAKDILMNRGSSPRVYRNTLVFLASDKRNLENLALAVRLKIAWDGIVQEIVRLNLTQSDAALAKEKAREAEDTLQTRLKEAWSWLIYPHQNDAHDDVEFTAGKLSTQDNILTRATKKLISEDALFTEMGPNRLNRDLEKYIWNDNPHIRMTDLWEYHNRYVYMPRLKSRDILTKSVSSSVSQAVAGPFAYAESYDEKKDEYQGLIIELGTSVPIVIDGSSLVVLPKIAEENRPVPVAQNSDEQIEGGEDGNGDDVGNPDVNEGKKLPTRFQGTVMISSDRPARDMHQIVEAIVEQLTVVPGSSIELKLEIDAEVPSGIDKDKSRTLLENASTLGFIDKELE